MGRLEINDNELSQVI